MEKKAFLRRNQEIRGEACKMARSEERVGEGRIQGRPGAQAQQTKQRCWKVWRRENTDSLHIWLISLIKFLNYFQFSGVLWRLFWENQSWTEKYYEQNMQYILYDLSMIFGSIYSFRRP